MKFVKSKIYNPYNIVYDNYLLHAERNLDKINMTLTFKNGDVLKLFCSPNGIVDFKDYFYFVRNNSIFIYDISSRSESVLLEIHNPDFLKISKFLDKLFVQSSISNSKNSSVYKGDELIWKQEIGGYIFYQSNCLFLIRKTSRNYDERNNYFNCHDFMTGDKFWTFKLSEHESKFKSQHPFDNPLIIKKTLGEYEGNIWFALNNGCVMAIDSETGAFKHWIRDIEGNDEPWANGSGYYSILPEANKAVMDTNKGQLVFFLRWYYWVLDLTTLQVDFHNLKSYFEEVGYNPKSLIQLDGNSILSTDHSTRQFASFNRAMLKFNWIEKVPDDVGLPTSIEKVNDKYYVKTNSTELLIYQNDKTEANDV